MSSLGLPPYCCLNRFNAAIQYVNLAALTLKKHNPLPLELTFVSVYRSSREERTPWLAPREGSARPQEQCVWGCSGCMTRCSKEEQVSQEVHGGAGTAAGAKSLLNEREGPDAVQ